MTTNTLLTLCVTGGLWLICPMATSAGPGATRETTQELVGVLESDASVQEKAIACRKLGEFGGPEAVPALAKLLDHEVLGAYARSGLERIPDPSASGALRSALETAQGPRLVGVISSLGAIRDERAVAALWRLAERDHPAVGRAALLALGRVASPDAVRIVMTALASGRAGAATACLLAAEQQQQRGRADVAIALYDAVRSADVSGPDRLGATRGAIVARSSPSFLMEQLGSDDASIREVALLAIREMPSAGLADALHARLQSAAPELRVLLITALRDCHNADSFAVVRSQLDSDAQAIRTAALGALSAVGRGPELAATLLDVVRERRSRAEKQTAAELLTRMEGGQAVDRVILDRLRSTQAADVRIDVIGVLGDRHVTGAVGELLVQARDEEPRVRVAALRSMRRMVGPEQVPALIARVTAEPDGAVRLAAVNALVSACGDDGPAGELVLAELKRASDASAQDAWTRVLTAIGYPKALPAILEGLADRDPEAVAGTITHLSRWPDPAPIAALLPLLEGDADARVRRRAVSAVIQLTTTAADQQQRPDDVLVAWFGRAGAAVETIEEKRQLLSGLARVHTLASFRLLEPYLKDPVVETEALYAMLSIGSPLVKAGEHAAIGEALPEESSLADELRWRFARLRRQVEAAEAPR